MFTEIDAENLLFVKVQTTFYTLVLDKSKEN